MLQENTEYFGQVVHNMCLVECFRPLLYDDDQKTSLAAGRVLQVDGGIGVAAEATLGGSCKNHISPICPLTPMTYFWTRQKEEKLL